jgi:hypothetical protein
MLDFSHALHTYTMRAATTRPRNNAMKDTRLSSAKPLLVVAAGAVAVELDLASLPMINVGAL